MITMAQKVWRKVGVRNGRPVLFRDLIYPGAASVAAALDTAFPWDETAREPGSGSPYTTS
jgi:hypothetical protein